MSEDAYSGLSDFLFADVENREYTEKRIGKPFPPSIVNYESDETEKEWTDKPIGEQLEQTLTKLKNKPMKKADQVFLIIGSKVDTTGPNFIQVLNRFKGDLISYYNEKSSRILIQSSTSALESILERGVPKYFENYLGMIRPLQISDQVHSTLQSEWDDSKTLMIRLMPNLKSEDLADYVTLILNYLRNNNREIFAENLSRNGLIFTQSKYSIIEKLLQDSSFVFNVSAIPQGFTNELKIQRKNALKAVAQTIKKENLEKLPKVVVMDSGLNDIAPLKNLIEIRDSYNYKSPDDDYDEPGHGTPIACLSTFGEENFPVAKIISYKIHSDKELGDAYLGMLNGIQKFKKYSRVFVTSIAFPNADSTFTYLIDRIVQHENIAFISSAGNITLDEITKKMIPNNLYPQYLQEYNVMCPSDGLSTISVGSIAKNNFSSGTHPKSIAKEGQISPYSRCSSSNPSLYDCKKPDFVEHGSNINFIDQQATSSGLSGLSSFSKSGSVTMELFGTSFSTPLLAKKFVDIDGKYGNQIKNVETIKAIYAISTTSNSLDCSGYGTPNRFLGCDFDHALFLAEGNIQLSDKTEKGKTKLYSDEIFIKVPNSSIEKITLCLVHSDNYSWNNIPSLNTFLNVEARKTGSDSVVEPTNPDEVDMKTNVKFLHYSFERKSMEATWRFRIKPELISGLAPKYRKQVSVRYGCAILLSRKSNKASKYSITKQVQMTK